MTNNELTSESIDKGMFSVWRFADWFDRSTPEVENESATSNLRFDLKKGYPDNAPEIIDFVVCALSRRQPIVEYLKKYPELNDHGFFMVICKLYLDTYQGIGHTNDRVTSLIAMFSTTNISRATAARILKKANEAEVFTSIRDSNDKRIQRYYLHAKMIHLFSDAFGGMIEDVLNNARNELPRD